MKEVFSLTPDLSQRERERMKRAVSMGYTTLIHPTFPIFLVILTIRIQTKTDTLSQRERGKRNRDSQVGSAKLYLLIFLIYPYPDHPVHPGYPDSD
ncbi:MAG: hypothetical protein ACE15F_04480 [bacterium]